jgi:hypothetical protein
MIKHLLNYFLFTFSMFAAGAVATGGGTGGAPPAGGTGGSGGDTGGTGGGTAIPGATETGGASKGLGTDAGAKEGQEIEGADDDFGTFEDFETGEAEVQAGSSEEFGPDTYKTVKEALKANPEVFKQVKKAVSMVKRYQEHFESPEAAGELLTDMQTMGGWDSIKQDMGETATFLNGWNAGDPAVVNSWLDENGEGLAKNMPTILDRWKTADPDAWAHDAAGTFMATMLSADPQTGLSPVAALNQLGAIEGVKDSDAYKTLLNRIKGIQARADQAPPKQVQAKGPDETKLTAREQRIQQQEQEMRRQNLGGKAAPILKTAADNALKLVAGGKKLSAQSRTDLVNDIHGEFARLMKADKDGESKRMKLLAAGQVDQWMKMVKSAADRTMPLAARRVWRKYAGISGMTAQQKTERKAEGQQRTETGGASTSTGSMETKSPGDGRQRDQQAMIKKFGSRDKADDAFLWGLPETGGKRVWIEKGTGKMFTY